MLKLLRHLLGAMLPALSKALNYYTMLFNVSEKQNINC